MRRMLCAVAALAAAYTIAVPAQAQVTIRTPGVSVETGPQPYWRGHHSEAWRSQDEFREAQQMRPEWQHDHCVRDWEGKTFCR